MRYLHYMTPLLCCGSVFRVEDRRGQQPKLGPRQVKLAREMYEEKDADGKRAHTVEHIAGEFGVTCPTIYRHLAKP